MFSFWPEFNLIESVFLFIISLAANVLSSMAGGGAGLLQFPALIFLGLPFTIALATHKIATVALGLGASMRHTRERHTALTFSFYILFCALPGVVLGAKFIVTLPETFALSALGLLTITLGMYSRYKPSLGQHFEPKNRSIAGLFLGGLMLFALGFFNGSLTSGTGLFVTLWLITWFGFDYKRAVAYTMILVGLFWNGLGALTLALHTPVKWEWLPALLLGSAIGGYLGASLAIKHGNAMIKRVFEWLAVAMGISLLIKAI